MSTAPLPDRGRRRVPDQPDGQPQLVVTDMARALSFYLALGCEVRRAADGWALLHAASVCFVLVHTAPGPGWQDRARTEQPATDPDPTIRLPTPRLRALHQKLQASGVPTTAITHPASAPAGEITIIDPDQHRVVLEQLTR